MTRFHNLVGTAAVFGLAVICVGSATADDEKQAKLVLKGGYTIVKGEREGEPIPGERIKGALIRFTDDETLGTDKDKKEFYKAKYKLDTSKTPWRITMTTVERKKADGEAKTDPRERDGDTAKSTTGLIKKEGNTIVIIYALPGGKEPAEFKTKKGDKTQMFWLENKNR